MLGGIYTGMWIRSNYPKDRGEMANALLYPIIADGS
jgi:hypothetical protein